MTASGYRGVVAMRPMDCPVNCVGGGGDTPMSMSMDTPSTSTPSNKRSRELDGEELMQEVAMGLPADHRKWGWASP